jgi:hypothetical protein
MLELGRSTNFALARQPTAKTAVVVSLAERHERGRLRVIPARWARRTICRLKAIDALASQTFFGLLAAANTNDHLPPSTFPPSPDSFCL